MRRLAAAILLAAAPVAATAADLDMSGVLSWTLPEGEVARVELGGETVWPSIPYVTNGLIAMWDGIWNAALGRHDGSATNWTCLVKGTGMQDFSWAAGTAGVSWEEGCLVLENGPGSSVPVCTFTGSMPEATTVEAVAKIVWVGGSSTIQNFVLWQGTITPCGKYTNGDILLCAYSSTANWYQSYNILANASLTNTASLAVLGPTINPATVYFNGVSGNLATAYGASLAHDVGLVRLQRPPCSRARVYCIRFYDRHLSAAEIARNAAIDAVRFGIGGGQ